MSWFPGGMLRTPLGPERLDFTGRDPNKIREDCCCTESSPRPARKYMWTCNRMGWPGCGYAATSSAFTGSKHPSIGSAAARCCKPTAASYVAVRDSMQKAASPTPKSIIQARCALWTESLMTRTRSEAAIRRHNSSSEQGLFMPTSASERRPQGPCQVNKACEVCNQRPLDCSHSKRLQREDQRESALRCKSAPTTHAPHRNNYGFRGDAAKITEYHCPRLGGGSAGNDLGVNSARDFGSRYGGCRQSEKSAS